MTEDLKDIARQFWQASDITLETGSKTSFIDPVGPWGTIIDAIPTPPERCYGGGKSAYADPQKVTRKSGTGSMKIVGVESLNLVIHFGETGNAPDPREAKRLAGILRHYFCKNGVRVTNILEDAINGRADIEVKLELTRDPQGKAAENQNALAVARHLALALEENIKLNAQKKLKDNAPALII